jgi:hypothetical protein
VKTEKNTAIIQTSQETDKPNLEIEANPLANLDPTASLLNTHPTPHLNNPETPEKPPQITNNANTDVEANANQTSPKGKTASKEKLKRTEKTQRERHRTHKPVALTTAAERTMKARRSERIIEKLTERSKRTHQTRPTSPMDMEIPDAEADADTDAQTMLESTKTTATTAQEETTETAKETKEKPSTPTNRDQALLMIYNAIVESNNKVDILSQELKK